jgi:hypothetical protein
LINIQAINPIRLANRTSIHPKAMKYKRKVMCCPVPGLRSSLFVFHHVIYEPVITYDCVAVPRYLIAELAGPIKDQRFGTTGACYSERQYS